MTYWGPAIGMLVTGVITFGVGWTYGYREGKQFTKDRQARAQRNTNRPDVTGVFEEVTKP